MSVDPGAQEIVIDENVDNLLHSGTLRERLQDPSLGEGTITLIIRDPNITIIGGMNLNFRDRREAPLYGCKSLLRVDLKGCTKLSQLGNSVFVECSSLTSVSLPDGLTQLGSYVFMGCSSLSSAADSAGFSNVVPYLRDRYKCVTLRKLILRLLGKYNRIVNEANGTEDEKHAVALARFPTDNSSSLDVGLLLQTMNASGGDGVKG